MTHAHCIIPQIILRRKRRPVAAAAGGGGPRRWSRLLSSMMGWHGALATYLQFSAMKHSITGAASGGGADLMGLFAPASGRNPVPVGTRERDPAGAFAAGPGKRDGSRTGEENAEREQLRVRGKEDDVVAGVTERKRAAKQKTKTNHRREPNERKRIVVRSKRRGGCVLRRGRRRSPRRRPSPTETRLRWCQRVSRQSPAGRSAAAA